MSEAPITPKRARAVLEPMELDKSLLANFTDQRWATRIHTGVENAAELLFEQFRRSPFAPSQPKKVRYLPTFRMLLANLKQAHEQGRALIVPRDTAHRKGDPRNPANITPKTLIPAMDFLHATGRIELHKMPSGVMVMASKLASWCVCTDALYALITREQIVYHEDTALIRLHDEAKKDKPLTYRQKREAKALEAPVRAMNDVYSRHHITLHGHTQYPFLYRVFNTSLELGGRFYGEFQTTPRDDRKAFRLDGEAVTELDFRAVHLYVLYALAGHQLPLDFDYTVPGLDRATAKAITLRIVNVENLTDLERCITKSGKPATKAAYAEYRAEREAYEAGLLWGAVRPEPVKPKLLKGFIENIPDGAKGADVLRLFLAAHEPVRELLGTPDIGVRLQFQDSQIMARILTVLAAQDTPALPVHDSLIVPLSQREAALELMAEAYREHTGFECPVEVKF